MFEFHYERRAALTLSWYCFAQFHVAVSKELASPPPCCCDWNLLLGKELNHESGLFDKNRLATEFVPASDNDLGKLCGCGSENDEAIGEAPMMIEEAATRSDSRFAERLYNDLGATFGVDGQSCREDVVVARPHEYGIGAMLHSLIKLSWKAIEENQSMQLARLDVWSNNKSCPEGDIGCFLDGPLGRNCKNASYIPEKQEVIQNTQFDTDAQHRWTGSYVKNRRNGIGNGDGIERFIDVATTMAFITRPADRVHSMLEAALLEMDWIPGQQPAIGVHARAGDSCNASDENSAYRTCDDLDAYIPHITRLADLYGTRRVILATDGGEKIHSATARFPQFTWHFLRRPSIAADKYVDLQIRDGRLDGFAEGSATLVDLMTLSLADAFVLKFTSNLDRAVIEVAAGKRGCVPPHISLDAAWCFGYQAIEKGHSTGHMFVSRGQNEKHWGLC